MSNSYFQFKQFTIQQDRCAMKVTTDSCLFGAWAAERVGSQQSAACLSGRQVSSRQSAVRRILDIGTGTGLLSLMLAQKNSTVIMDTIEIDEEAFKQAKENIIASPWKDRINIFHADARKFAFPSRYDMIISNPPFYENELTSANNKKNIAYHDDGLLLYELFQVINEALDTEGQFYLLLPVKRMLEAGLLLQKYELAITHATLVKQSTRHGHFRVFTTGKRIGNIDEKYTKDEITICNEKKEYTKEFINLLKDYYLYL